MKNNALRVPVISYDAFVALQQNHIISDNELSLWKKAIGLRNAIVHGYMDVDMEIVRDVVLSGHFAMLLGFLRRPMPDKN